MRSWLKRATLARGVTNQRKRSRNSVRNLIVEFLDVRLPLAIETQLVKDINLLPDLSGNGPRNFVQVGSTLFFAASTQTAGEELWKSDGTAMGTVLVKDIRPGSLGSYPSNFTNISGTVFFVAKVSSYGYDLWKSDGTTSGTIKVMSFGDDLLELTDVNGTLFFNTSNSSSGSELWKSDGTAAGTVLVKDIRIGTGSANPSGLTNVNGVLFFTANDGSTGTELWKSDGTESGTNIVRDIRLGGSAGSSSPASLANANGTLFFSADGNGGRELWKSDGTSAGTVVVKDIRSGRYGSYVSEIVNVNGTIFFVAADSPSDRELWKSDGTNAGTTLVRDIRTGTNGSVPKYLTNVNGVLFFRANDGFTGDELWKSNGTLAGTGLVQDIRAGVFSSEPKGLTNVNGALFFVANDGSTGFELWKSIVNNAQLVRDIWSGFSGSTPTFLTNLNGKLFFNATNGTSGQQFWSSDGTVSGTAIVTTIRSGNRSSTNPSIYISPTNLNGTVYFRASDGSQGPELWRTDGTNIGTTLVKDIWSGPNGSNPNPIANVNGTLFFGAADNLNGRELWKSDGTTAGTELVKNISNGNADSYPLLFTDVNGTVFFQTKGSELWKSNGTNAGTVMVKDLRGEFFNETYLGPFHLTNVNGVLYFMANNRFKGDNGYELWKSDGTSAGTLMVKDINVGSSDAFNFRTDIAGFAPSVLNGLLYFPANDGINGTELWRSDGTAEGTTMVKNIFVGSFGSDPKDLTVVNGTLYFRARNNADGIELWKSDGTSEGTVQLMDIHPGNASSVPDNFTDVNGTLYFTARTGGSFGQYDEELWKSDGTAAGTIRVKDIRDGSIGSNPRNLTNVNGILYFGADDGNGEELWRSDGTESGTRSLANFVSRNGIFEPRTLLSVGDSLYYTSLTNEFGRELWRLRENKHVDITLSQNTIAENAGVNAIVGVLGSTDVNTGDTFTYTLVAGAGDTDNSAFNINGSNLRATNSFDFESRQSYTVRVRSTDHQGLWIEKSFTISVANANESPTNISLSGSSIPENAGVNATIGTLSTTDPDSANTFTYSLAAGTGDGDNAAFNINGSTLRATNSLDFEAKSTLTVRVRSTDQGGLFTEKVFTITVTDINDAPTDILLTPSTIPENSDVNTTVGTLSTTDQDPGNTFTYALVIGVGDADNAAFNISGTTLRANSTFDFETKSSYTVRVRSTDQDGLFTEKSFTISVTNSNEAPTDIELSPKSIEENAGAHATIGILSTTDPDAGNSFTYGLVAGDGDSDNAVFNVIGSTLRATNSFDFETKSSYAIRVRSTDQGGLFTEKTFTISVTDVNDAPSDIDLSPKSIPENAGANAIVGTLSTTDPDPQNTFTYALVTGTVGNDNAAFNIDGSTLRATNSFDFESKSSYTVRVRSTDQGGLFTEKMFTITVTNANDAPTGVDLSPRSIPENAGENATVGTLLTIDVDPDNTFTYTLVAGAGDADNSAFNISGSTLRATNSFDLETKSSYTVRIRSTDQGGLFTDQSFTIRVTNANDPPSDIDLSNKTLAENAGASFEIGTLTSNDPDPFNTFTYSLVAGTGDTDNAAFQIDGASFRAINSLDFETKSTYSVRIRSTDQGDLFTEKVFTITLTNVNESPTDINLAPTLIAENAGGNALIGALSTIDPDAGNTFFYTLVTGAGSTDNASFLLTNNQIRARASFDFETKKNYSIRVRATDAGGLSTEKVLAVTVTDVNEPPTSVQLNNALQRVAEETTFAQPLSLADIVVIDDALGTFQFALTGQDPSHFEIRDQKLWLKAGTRFNFESQSIYRVRVQASDPSLTNSTPVFRDYELNIDNVPEVTGVTIVDGAGWQNSVRRVRIQWDMHVNLTNSAIGWKKTDVENANVAFTTQTSLVNGRTVADVQFTGKYIDLVGLLDGDYELTIAGDQVTAANSSVPGLGFVNRYRALRPKKPFEMRVEPASPVGIDSKTIMTVQVVGLNEAGNNVRYEIDWNSDGVIDRTVLGGSSLSLDDVSFASGGSRTITVEAIRGGQSIAKASSVVDVIPSTTQGADWTSTLDVNLDKVISSLDALSVVNMLNSRRGSQQYDVRHDANRDGVNSSLDILTVVNYLNLRSRTKSPSPFVSITMADTGATDGLTSDVGVSGVVKNANSKLFASLDGRPRREVVGAIGANGQFAVTDAALASLFGGSLEGDHLLTVGTLTNEGIWQGMDRYFTRTTRLPGAFEIVTAVQDGGLRLSWTSAGNGMRYRVLRNVVGQAPDVISNGLSGLATQITLPLGTHEIFVEAYDHVGNKSTTQTLRVLIK